MEDFKQSLTENSYTRQEELVFWDCDREKRMRVAAILSKMAAFAGYDYDARGLTHEMLYDRREVFLLSRIAVRIHVCPHARDVLTITTWENGAKAAHMQRVFEMADQTGRLCVSAKSDWILVDPIPRKILRPSAFTAKPLGPAVADTDCPDCRKILPPREKLAEAAVRKVRFTDLDHNGHLYSGRYPDIVWDELPEDLQRGTLRDFQINYSKEATLGEELTLLACREGQTYEMEGLCGPERCFTCRCEFV